MNTTQLRVGDHVLVVEHHDPTRTRLPDGDVHPATVTGIVGQYVNVRYDDPAVNRGREDSFWRQSGWRAWDGAFRWRLGTPQTTGDMTRAERVAGQEET